ncbi:DUF3806 domain-containing protein [Gilvimarinus algae]|uniref:DUF3806 domain-containing protein n=1 Tax=Gilvimarinus algae TaxID=3058037 RepID=A0ABT8TE48_9GAMM|nr:DUF3806 domain-containing protein [Gilvimarinus sp. SDUM040014]MDO3382191.1 DUF3806 domain-containing protein [Gilvimarinus sp. SDUM040014]
MNATFKALIALLVFCSASTLAQEPSATVTITDLSWTDESFLSNQRARVDRLTKEQLGTPLRGDKTDLSTLQRIVDRELIGASDTLALQALGVVLGDAMIVAEPELEWKVYEDKLGRSRALCAASVNECLFPVTMLSRRMAAGLKPDVKKVYVEALELIAESLPELPYGGERQYTPY